MAGKKKPGQVAKFVEGMVLGAAATVCFAATLWLALTDKASAATVTGVLAAGILATRYLPLFDSIEILGLKAKLRQSVSEADALLENLRNAAATGSKLSYVQLAYLGRMGSLTWPQKVGLMAEVDLSLEKLGEPTERIAAQREPLLRFAVVDLYYFWFHVLHERVEHRRRGIRAIVDDKFGRKAIPAGDVDHKRLMTDLRSLHDPEQLDDDLLSDPNLKAIRKFMSQQLERTGLPAEDQEKLMPLLSEVAAIADRIWHTSSIPADVIAFLHETAESKFWQSRYEALFGISPGK